MMRADPAGLSRSRCCRGYTHKRALMAPEHACAAVRTLAPVDHAAPAEDAGRTTPSSIFVDETSVNASGACKAPGQRPFAHWKTQTFPVPAAPKPPTSTPSEQPCQAQGTPAPLQPELSMASGEPRKHLHPLQENRMLELSQESWLRVPLNGRCSRSFHGSA